MLDLSAVFTRAATPPSSAKFRLLEIVVLSRLSPQPPIGAVLTAGSDLSFVSVFVCCRFCLVSQVSVLSQIFGSLLKRKSGD